MAWLRSSRTSYVTLCYGLSHGDKPIVLTYGYAYSVHSDVFKELNAVDGSPKYITLFFLF
jgi:hypothetical protein